MTTYNVHPEVRQEFVRQLFEVSKKKTSYDIAQDEAYVKTWNKCLKETNDFLSTYCPAPSPDAFELIERECQLQEVIEEEYEDEEDY